MCERTGSNLSYTLKNANIQVANFLLKGLGGFFFNKWRHSHSTRFSFKCLIVRCCLLPPILQGSSLADFLCLKIYLYASTLYNCNILFCIIFQIQNLLQDREIYYLLKFWPSLFLSSYFMVPLDLKLSQNMLLPRTLTIHNKKL